ncbi:MFS transporter [Aquabacterium sp.]|uniref:MFS transporter n=1 Tax=Aquabacterium sp. TaxID=1872578 RepID=UPI003BB1D523
MKQETTGSSPQQATARDSRGGVAALVIGHCAGLMDITALPVWVGMVLIGGLAIEPQRAGFLLSLFLGSVVLSSLYFAPRLIKLRRKHFTWGAYGLAAATFACMPSLSDTYAFLAAAHVIAGMSVGCGLTMVHGTMGGTANPHRTAAIAFTSLSLISIVLMATLPPALVKLGPNLFFYTMAGIMLTASIASLLAFPNVGAAAEHGVVTGVRVPRRVWYGIAGVSLLMVSHSMVFGFVERIGAGHGFSSAQITTALIVSGFANLVPVALSGFLEQRLRAASVIVAGPLIQAAAALVVTNRPEFEVYVLATCVLIAVVTFTHVFAFGVLARLDPTGRVVGATPVMVMTGSATGPLIGGVLAQHVGYSSLGWCAILLGTLCATSFWLCCREQTVANGQLAQSRSGA